MGALVCSLKTRWVVSLTEKWNARDRTALGRGEKSECYFGPAKLQILLIFEDQIMKVKKEFGAKIGDLAIK